MKPAGQLLENLFIFSTGNRAMCKFILNGGRMVVAAQWLNEPTEQEAQALEIAVPVFLSRHGIGILELDTVHAESTAHAVALQNRFFKSR